MMSLGTKELNREAFMVYIACSSPSVSAVYSKDCHSITRPCSD